MWLLREKLSDFGVKQILYRVDIALYAHPKNSLRSHLRAITALAWSQYIRRGKQILRKQIRENFLRSTSLQILANKSGCVQTNLLFFFFNTPHLRRKSTMRRCLHSFNIQDHRSTRGLLISETVQKISKITYTASQF